MAIKILHLIKSLGRGGAEMLLPETLQLHNKKNFEFHYIYFLPWKNQMVKPIIKSGGKVICLSSNNNLSMLIKLFRVINYCKKNDIQLIHAHLPWAGILGRLVHIITGIPLIYTEHNMQERYHALTAFVNKLTFNMQTLALAVSEDVKYSIINNIHPQVEVKTLLNGVNTSKFNPEFPYENNLKSQLGIPSYYPIVGNIAVFRDQKRLDKWVEQANKIYLENNKVRFVLLGDGPKEAFVKETIKKYKMQDVIFLPGRLEEVRPWLKIFDVFMISSEYEGLPIALLEAMSMKLPVVSTNAGGIKEVISHLKNGWVVEVDDVDKLSEGVILLLTNQKLANQLGHEARITIEQNFSMINMIESLESHYHNILDNVKI